MDNVIVPLNAFDRMKVLDNGQASYVEMIAESGAGGIEIRRELLLSPIQVPQLELIRDKIKPYRLFTVYSAPIELWNENHDINNTELTEIFQEGMKLGAKWIKVSLGHFHKNKSDVLKLKHIVNQYPEIQLLVENDQTLYGGNIRQLESFFKTTEELHVPVKMTFDTGNWYYTGQDVLEALNKLSPFVIYLHLKQVEEKMGELITVPLQKKGNAIWEKIMTHFPDKMAKALEFPIEPKEDTKKYIRLVTESAREGRTLSCSS